MILVLLTPSGQLQMCDWQLYQSPASHHINIGWDSISQTLSDEHMGLGDTTVEELRTTVS